MEKVCPRDKEGVSEDQKENPVPTKNKLTKLGRCDSYTIEWLNNRTARLLVLLGIQAQTARIHLAPLSSTWLHLASVGPPLAPLGQAGSVCLRLATHQTVKNTQSYTWTDGMITEPPHH